MNYTRIAKLLALLAASLGGVATILAGDVTTGVGIIAASLSSVTALRS